MNGRGAVPPAQGVGARTRGFALSGSGPLSLAGPSEPGSRKEGLVRGGNHGACALGETPVSMATAVHLSSPGPQGSVRAREGSSGLGVEAALRRLLEGRGGGRRGPWLPRTDVCASGARKAPEALEPSGFVLREPTPAWILKSKPHAFVSSPSHLLDASDRSPVRAGRGHVCTGWACGREQEGGYRWLSWGESKVLGRLAIACGGCAPLTPRGSRAS